MTWLSTLLALAVAGVSITSALPSPHEDQRWAINNRRAPAAHEDQNWVINNRRDVAGLFKRTNGTTVCSLASESEPVSPPPKSNIWLGLSNEEAIGLLRFVHDPKTGLNLTAYDNATAWDNYITVTEAIMPNKTDAVKYLDTDSKEVPSRYARVVVSVGATEEPYLTEYMVGPLPVTEKTTIAPFTYTYNRDGTSKTPNYLKDSSAISKWRQSLGAKMQDITLDLLGTVLNGSTTDTSALQSIDPLQKEGDRIIQWVQFRGVADKKKHYSTSTLLPQGLYLKLDITGRVAADWKLKAILYNNIMYKSIEEFREATKKPEFVRLAKTVEGDWARTVKQGAALPLDELPPPLSVQAHKRWTVDKKDKYVTWMDFSFYIAFNRDVGITLYDVKYKGERIIYEIGLQEAIAHYAGNDPKQSGTAFLDGYYGFGPNYWELVKGYDCPTSASFLDTVLHQNGKTTTNKDSICLFEQDMGYPISRHTTSAYAGVTKNIGFIVRGISTIGNYDYLFDYVFYIDGSIEVKVRASGYIQSAFYANNEDYGYQIHDHLSGSMHDHVLTFKADIDIHGTANSFEETKIVSKAIEYAWSNGPVNTMALERHILETEDEGKINYAPNGASIFTVVNTDTPNKYGVPPGYRIMPGSGTPIHVAVVDSYTLKESADFGTHHMYVTKQKDTEPRLAAASNNMNPGEPVVKFGKFFDGESIKQEDIVVWFNLGMHHVPHSGDLPNTVMTTAQSSVMITPHNYLAMDASRQTFQQVEVIIGDKEAKVENFGKVIPDCSAPLGREYPALTDYTGASTINKMPFLEYAG
ncbi:copper amine oxidase [Peziza echinospora]|nr:copper amine oxidase [Peziza echinospora]